MSKQVEVKSVGAIINGKPLGSTFKVSGKTAKRLIDMNYVEEVKQVKKQAAKKEVKKETKKETKKDK